MGLTAVNTNYKERLGIVMELKIGDIVEFKKYEDMSDDERMMIDKDDFPSFGTVKEINAAGCDRIFNIEEKGYKFCTESVARVISNVDDVDVNSLKPGDEILVKATVKEVFNTFLQIEPSIDRTDVIDILKRKEPERFIVKENCYGMYIGTARELVNDKSKAKIYTSRITANEDAADMHLNAWDVIKYDA